MTPYPSNTNGRGGLFRSLLLPLIALAALAGILGSLSETRLQQREDRDALMRTLQGHLELIGQLHLPPSPRLAAHFSTASGRPVAFVQNDGTLFHDETWSAAERQLAQEAAANPTTWTRHDTREALALSLPKEQIKLVALRQHTPWWHWKTPRHWPWFACLLLLSIGVAFAVAQRWARPLSELANASSQWEKRDLPESLTARPDELGILARHLNQARQRFLEEQTQRQRHERLAMLGQITTGLAHEIKNPAAAIALQAQALASEHPLTAQALQSQADEILSLVNQWLYLAHPSPPQPIVHDWVTETQTLLKEYQPRLSYHDIAIDFSHPPKPLLLLGDRQRLRQALRNLIENAIAAMPHGGTLHLTAQEQSDHLSICFEDEGSGFSKAALAHAGDAFFSEKEGGMGLGLALVRGVIEAHHGQVFFENRPQGGARIRWTLPLTPQAS